MTKNQKNQIFSAVGVAHGRIECGLDLHKGFIDLEKDLAIICADPKAIIYDQEEQHA